MGSMVILMGTSVFDPMWRSNCGYPLLHHLRPTNCICRSRKPNIRFQKFDCSISCDMKQIVDASLKTTSSVHDIKTMKPPFGSRWPSSCPSGSTRCNSAVDFSQMMLMSGPKMLGIMFHLLMTRARSLLSRWKNNVQHRSPSKTNSNTMINLPDIGLYYS